MPGINQNDKDAYTLRHVHKRTAAERQKRRQIERRNALVRLLLRFAALVLIVIAAIFIIKAITSKRSPMADENQTEFASALDAGIEENSKEKVTLPVISPNASVPGEDVNSDYISVLCLDTNEITVNKACSERMYPASTTKIMTLLVACENCTDMNKTFTFTYELIDPLYRQEASMAGFLSSETVTVKDLIYGTILPSGAEAAEALAISVAGSVDNFVVLMNEKAKQLGLTDTHFTNVTGLYNKEHYTTAYDLSIITREAYNNEQCREVLSTYQYTTSVTAQHAEGIPLTSTLFSHIYGTEPDGSDITGGKTGFVNESGYCIATFGKSDSGRVFVCVTGKADGLWPAIYDQINIYSAYAK